jgi:hypothetical protein
MRLYQYVGPREIADRAGTQSRGMLIRSADDIWTWIESTKQELLNGQVIGTFIVDQSGMLRIADRRSEHVACAGGEPVQSAGEITFAVGKSIDVAEVSNQSTGYCPEPRSWSAVAAALTRAGLTPPDGFTLACEFRRCTKCDGITLVKNGVLRCGICDAALPATYNVQ